MSRCQCGLQSMGSLTDNGDAPGPLHQQLHLNAGTDATVCLIRSQDRTTQMDATARVGHHGSSMMDVADACRSRRNGEDTQPSSLLKEALA